MVPAPGFERQATTDAMPKRCDTQASMQTTATPALIRTLRLRDVVLFMVTAGTNLQWVATAAAAGPSSLVVWVIVGLMMFLPLSVCVVFLSSRHPDQGGLYVWGKLAFGPFAGFMTGWTYWTSNLPYFPSLLYFAAGNALYLSSGPDGPLASPGYFIAFSIAGLTASVLLNVLGLRAAKWLNNLGAVMRWVSVALLAALGVAAWWRFGSATVIDAGTMRPHTRLTDLIFWSALAFAWTGPEAASFMGGEIDDPRRTVPRALGIAAPMIAVLYLLGTASVLISVPAGGTSALYGVLQAISGAAQRFGMSWLVPVGAVCVTITCLSSVCAWLGAVARIPFAAGIDHYLPKSFAYLHPRYGSPVVAILMQAVIAALFAVLGQAGTSVKGAYDVLVSMTVIGVMVPFLGLFGAAIKLSGGPPREGASRIPGGRWVLVTLALVGLATTLGSIVLAFVPAADDATPALTMVKVAGLNALLLGCGGFLYWAGSRSARRAALAVQTAA
jgi:amino acid transporter